MTFYKQTLFLDIYIGIFIPNISQSWYFSRILACTTNDYLFLKDMISFSWVLHWIVLNLITWRSAIAPFRHYAYWYNISSWSIHLHLKMRGFSSRLTSSSVMACTREVWRRHIFVNILDLDLVNFAKLSCKSCIKDIINQINVWCCRWTNNTLNFKANIA